MKKWKKLMADVQNVALVRMAKFVASEEKYGTFLAAFYDRVLFGFLFVLCAFYIVCVHYFYC